MSRTRRLTTAQALVEFLVVVCAAGSMPGDLHKLWRTRDPKQFHLEYGNSCMGYEIPGAIGIRMADPSREVFAMVGDAGWLMSPGELVTAVAERVRIIVVLVQNHGYASIGSLSEASGNGRLGTRSAEVSDSESVRRARADYERNKQDQRHYL